MRNVDKILRSRHWIFAGNTILNRKLIILSDSSTQSYSKILKSVDVFPEMSRKFRFSFLTPKSCMEIKNEKWYFLLVSLQS